MATIELDIIKQRCDKLTPDEKMELIDYLAATLTPEEIKKLSNQLVLQGQKNQAMSEPPA